MRKFVPMIAAAVLVTLAQSAYANEISGRIHSIDTVRNTFSVGDKYFQWSAANSVGVRLKDLREGQPVWIRYEANQEGHNDVQDMRVQH
jgi:hypothetical protein